MVIVLMFEIMDGKSVQYLVDSGATFDDHIVPLSRRNRLQPPRLVEERSTLKKL